MTQLALTTYRGCAGDRNERGMLGAALLGQAIAERTGLSCTLLGQESAPLANGRWDQTLAAARAGLLALAETYGQLLSERRVPITTFGRCACGLATLPVVAKHRPDAVVVYFDAHGDLNTPATSATGYLGGLVISGAAGLWNSGLGEGLDLARVVLVGARDLDPPEQELIAAGQLHHVPPGPGLIPRLHEVIGTAPVYVHIDCDVLDPGLVPTEYVVSGGLSLGDLRAACALLAQNEIVCAEIAEFEATWRETGAVASPAGLIEALEPLFVL